MLARTRNEQHNQNRLYEQSVQVISILLPTTTTLYIPLNTYEPEDRGSTVFKILCYKSEGRWFDSRWCHWNFSLTQSFLSHYGPGVDSASDRNEYGSISWG